MLVLDKELEYLNQMLLKMASIVQKNIMDAFDAYRTGNLEMVINDDIVDQYERLIEEICLDILLKERLYARDLRKVSGILRMVSDLERIGDHAEDINNFHTHFPHEEVDKLKGFIEVVEVASSMVIDAILSFVNEDLELAAAVIKRDNIVDEGYNDLIRTIIHDIENQQIDPTIAIYATLVIKYIERIGDHAVNIAEWAVYIVSGYYKDKQIF